MRKKDMKTIGDSVNIVDLAADTAASATVPEEAEKQDGEQVIVDEVVDDKAVLLSDVIRETKETTGDQTLPSVKNVIDFDVPAIVGFEPAWKQRHEDDLDRFDYCFVRKDNEFAWKKQAGGGGWEPVEDHPDILQDVKLCRRPKALGNALEERNERMNQMREAAISPGLADAVKEVSAMFRVPVEKLLHMGEGMNLPTRRAGQTSKTKFYSIPGM